jgi:hypothetical protein
MTHVKLIAVLLPCCSAERHWAIRASTSGGSAPAASRSDSSAKHLQAQDSLLARPDGSGKKFDKPGKSPS